VYIYAIMTEQNCDPDDEIIELEPELPPGMEPEEGTAKTRRISKVGFSAYQQDSIIPLGWRPTNEKPIPVVRCSHIYPDRHERAGERCRKWSLRGTTKCYRHSGNGNLKNVDKYRQAVIEAARLDLLDMGPDALDTLKWLFQNATSEAVRLKAATEVLDRSGLKGGHEVDVSVNVGTNPSEILKDRLAALRQTAVDDATQVIEGELVESRETAETPAIEGESVQETREESVD